MIWSVFRSYDNITCLTDPVHKHTFVHQMNAQLFHAFDKYLAVLVGRTVEDLRAALQLMLVCLSVLELLCTLLAVKVTLLQGFHYKLVHPATLVNFAAVRALL